MPKLFRVPNSNHISFWCPGCKEAHFFNTTWSVTGTDECPTVAPSILVTRKMWDGPDRPPKDLRCHSFIRDGQIEFLGDCTHELKNTKVPMEEYREA